MSDTAARAELTLAEVEHVALLARLGLTDQEKELYRQQLGSILGYVAQLGEIDTERIPPSAAILPLEDVMAEDEPRPSLDPEDVLANAPEQEDGYFRVPAVLDEP
ncbi:MAG TPA: Asp-tRNA(Asn)/Glu-tRNA(Gln) amidotransferase subunit GatC [Chloroflexota bacterium]